MSIGAGLRSASMRPKQRGSGTTTFVDAGSSGPGNFHGFRRHVIEPSPVGGRQRVRSDLIPLFLLFLQQIISGRDGFRRRNPRFLAAGANKKQRNNSGGDPARETRRALKIGIDQTPRLSHAPIFVNQQMLFHQRAAAILFPPASPDWRYSAAVLFGSAAGRVAWRSISAWIAALACPRKSSWCCTAKS